MKFVKLVAVMGLLLMPAPAFCRAKGHLYNLKTGEVITVAYTRCLFTGHGKIQATLHSGEVLKGEWSVVRQGFSSWGNIYTSVYGSSGFAAGGGRQYSSVTSDSALGAGILTGKNEAIECEFLVGSLHGMGACRDQDGTFYKLIF